MLPGDPRQLANATPVGRVGRPDEVADLALAILRNGYVTSQVFSIDGGCIPAERNRWPSRIPQAAVHVGSVTMWDRLERTARTNTTSASTPAASESYGAAR